MITLPPSPFRLRLKGLGYFRKGDVTPPKVGESYFGTCERDKEGHCLPSGQSEGGGGKEPPKGKPAKEAAVRSEMSGVKREGAGKEAKLTLEDGSPAPEHIKPSMVPAQWTDVKIAIDPKAEVLVQGRDKAGRMQTVYSSSYTMKQAAAKFARIHELMDKKEVIFKQNQTNRNSTDEAVREAADCTWLIQEQGTRPGSDTDSKAKVKAYGATTLTAEHVVVKDDGSIYLDFIGKEGVHHNHRIRNHELARMLVDRKKTAGERGGRLFATSDAKLRAYTATLDGGKFTPKDFRTVKATTMAIEELKKVKDKPKTDKDFKAKVKEIATVVSSVLGNKPAQAIESYIAPEVWAVLRE